MIWVLRIPGLRDAKNEMPADFKNEIHKWALECKYLGQNLSIINLIVHGLYSNCFGRIGHAAWMPAEKSGIGLRATANYRLRALFAAVYTPFGNRKFQIVEIHSDPDVEKVRQNYGLFHRVYKSNF